MATIGRGEKNPRWVQRVPHQTPGQSTGWATYGEMGRQAAVKYMEYGAHVYASAKQGLEKDMWCNRRRSILVDGLVTDRHSIPKLGSKLLLLCRPATAKKNIIYLFI